MIAYSDLSDAQLSALVAEKVMGWVNNRANPESPGMWGIMDRTEKGPVLVPDFPSYATDWNAAMEVVEAMEKRSDFAMFDLELIPASVDPNKWRARFTTTEQKAACDANPARAICLSALAVLGVNAAA